MNMKKLLLNAMILSILVYFYAPAASAVEVAPRISDREIVEKLSRLEEGQKRLEGRMDDLRSEMTGRFETVDKRFYDLRTNMNSRFETVNKRFDDLTWMFGLFVTIGLAILGFVIRMQWQMQKNQTQMKTSLETLKDEMAFLKRLIEKLMPPQRGAL